MNKIVTAAAFATRLYAQRAQLAYAGYVRHRPMARLSTRPGRTDPYAIYDRMRADGTLALTPLGNWVTTSHRVCETVLRDRAFGVRPVDSEPVANEGVDDMSMLDMNPPDHTRLRRLALPALHPKVIAGYRDRIERTVGDLVDRAIAAGRFDLVSTFAAPLPITVIADLLGIPDADSTAFAHDGAVIGSALDGIRSLRQAAELQRSDGRLRELFENLLALRRREPTDDIVSRLVAAEGDQIKSAEMVPMCELLLIAGFETTVNAIGNGVLALLDHPDQWEALCADPETMAPKAVEEVLRYDPPVQRTGRFALEPFELDGKPVRKGQFVVTLIGAAGRDPEAYDRPDTFDITRDPGPNHLAFSSGIHYCVGQPLARLELIVAFQTLAERLPGLHRAGPVRRRNSTTIRGPIQLPLTAGARIKSAAVPT
ncbi:MAG TPA: cytochrome P450 [Pseudonocardiaceae bacterium]|nr:cytochrome P450 [Pseudonocardiaceae bacterium]